LLSLIVAEVEGVKYRFLLAKYIDELLNMVILKDTVTEYATRDDKKLRNKWL